MSVVAYKWKWGGLEDGGERSGCFELVIQRVKDVREKGGSKSMGRWGVKNDISATGED
jgi:hypothetical protein